MKRGIKLVLLAVLAVLLLLVAAACGGGAKSGAPKTYKLGANWEKTGWGGYYGTQSGQATELVVKLTNEAGGVNGKQIELITYDNETEAEVTATNVRKLVEQDKVLAMVGPIFNQNAKAAMAANAGLKTPLAWSTTGQRAASNSQSYDFNVFPREEGFAQSVLSYLKDVYGVKKIAVLATTDDSGEEDLGYAVMVGKELGLEVVMVERVDPDATDVTAQLTKIKNAKVDAMHLGGGGAVIGPMMKGIKLLGLDIPVSGPTGLTGGEMLALMKGFEPEKLVLPAMPPMVAGLNILSADNPLMRANNKFAEAWIAAYGDTREKILMEDWGWVGWDATNWMVDAMKRAGSALDGDLQAARDAIRNQLENTKNFETTWGVRNTSPSDHSGIPTEEFHILTVKNGKLVLLK